jgi:hypothetical protein
MEAAVATKPKSEVTTVVMQDGRSVDFVGKRKMLKETIINGSQVSVRLDFRNSETRTFVVPDGLLLKFAGHGAEQKLGDETSGEDDVDDMTLSVDELIDRLNKGEWTTRREGGGMAGTSILFRALVEHLAGKQTPAEIKAKLMLKTPAEKTAMRSASKLKPIIDRLEAEKAARNTKVDMNTLFVGLE